MKSELRRHLTPLLSIFSITSLYWLFQKTDWYYFVFLFLGLAIGAFLLDLDHLIYWLYLNPNIEESRLAQLAFKKKDFISLIKLLESTYQHHTNLIFHHFFFQFVLSVITIFVFTSSHNVFAMSFTLALNIHLLVDEIHDFYLNRHHLQDWLFARETKQLPLNFLPHYLIFFTILAVFFTFSLIRFTP